MIHPSGTPFAPEVMGTVPELKAVEVMGTVPEMKAVEVRVGWICS